MFIGLTTNEHAGITAIGKLFQEIPSLENLFRTFRVLALGKNGNKVLILTLDGKGADCRRLSLFEVSDSRIDLGEHPASLPIALAVPQTFLLRPIRTEDPGRTVFTLRQDRSLKPIDFERKPFKVPMESDSGRRGTLRRPESGPVRRFAIREYRRWEVPRMRTYEKDTGIPIVLAGKLKDHFVILPVGETYVLVGIPGRIAEPIWNRVMQGNYAIAFTEEQGFFIPVIRPCD